MKSNIEQENKCPYLIFSDLDGTLLDHDTYGFEEAQRALLCIKALGIPLILCSSKTRVEIESLRKALNNNDPFVAENGAAIFIPRGILNPIPLFPLTFNEIEGYRVIELGASYQKLKASFAEIKAVTGIKATGFSEMSIEQIAQTTGLSFDQAALAKQREYSEPFLFLEENPNARWSRLEQEVLKRDLKLVKGGRFYHLIGPNDKGKAVRLLRELYQKTNRSLVSIGLGDSPNDFPMLENVSVPVLIQKKIGKIEPWPGSTPVYRPREIGPKGWNAFILDLLKEDCYE
jgi:mannosyl-3-phosphoglycerate phosphatase